MNEEDLNHIFKEINWKFPFLFRRQQVDYRLMKSIFSHTSLTILTQTASQPPYKPTTLYLASNLSILKLTIQTMAQS